MAIVAIGGLLATVGPWGDDAAPATTIAGAPASTSVTTDSTPRSGTTGDDGGVDDTGTDSGDGAPVGVTAEYFATSDGWLLSWENATPNSGQAVVFIHRADQPPLTEVPPPGSNTHVVVADVAADEPVCFVVANVVIDADEPITAEGEPVCRNGAVAEVPSATAGDT